MYPVRRYYLSRIASCTIPGRHNTTGITVDRGPIASTSTNQVGWTVIQSLIVAVLRTDGPQIAVPGSGLGGILIEAAWTWLHANCRHTPDSRGHERQR